LKKSGFTIVFLCALCVLCGQFFFVVIFVLFSVLSVPSVAGFLCLCVFVAKNKICVICGIRHKCRAAVISQPICECEL